MLAAISQEAFAHVPEKPRLIEECIRIVKPGGMIASTGRKPG
jgi:ubiquinone/menaquinone biosynthesis C-methylase UbiE